MYSKNRVKNELFCSKINRCEAKLALVITKNHTLLTIGVEDETNKKKIPEVSR